MGDLSDDDSFITWLAANIENVRNGCASYKGTRVTGESLVVRYSMCMSLLIVTTRTCSPYLLRGSEEDTSTFIKSTAITLCFGWWGFPFGVIFTPLYLIKNIFRADRCTVSELIKLLENPAELQKKRDSFQYAPLMVMLAAFGGIAALMLAMQGYLWLTKGAVEKHRPGSVDTAPGARDSSSMEQAERPRRDGSRLTGDPVSDYMVNLQRRLKHEWHPPKGNETARVVVRFEIDKYGVANNPRIETSSGNVEMDRAAIKAIKAAQPYPPLPAVLKGTAPIQFTFDYNVFDQNKRKMPGKPRRLSSASDEDLK